MHPEIHVPWDPVTKIFADLVIARITPHSRVYIDNVDPAHRKRDGINAHWWPLLLLDAILSTGRHSLTLSRVIDQNRFLESAVSLIFHDKSVTQLSPVKVQMDPDSPWISLTSFKRAYFESNPKSKAFNCVIGELCRDCPEDLMGIIDTAMSSIHTKLSILPIRRGQPNTKKYLETMPLASSTPMPCTAQKDAFSFPNTETGLLAKSEELQKRKIQQQIRYDQSYHSNNAPATLAKPNQVDNNFLFLLCDAAAQSQQPQAKAQAPLPVNNMPALAPYANYTTYNPYAPSPYIWNNNNIVNEGIAVQVKQEQQVDHSSFPLTCFQDTKRQKTAEVKHVLASVQFVTPHHF